MNDLSKACIDEAKQSMQSAINFLEKELGKIRASKANPGMLEGVKVDYYGTMTEISQVANVNTPDPRTIIIQPWEKTLVGPINKAILDANLGFTPRHEGDILRIIVPPLTEERRKELVKKVKQETEQAKVNIRNIRRNANVTNPRLLERLLRHPAPTGIIPMDFPSQELIDAIISCNRDSPCCANQ